MLDRDYQHGNGPDKEPWFGRFTSQMEDTCGSMPGALKCSSSFWTCANSSLGCSGCAVCHSRLSPSSASPASPP